MKRRQITISGDRYLIFYTFEKEAMQPSPQTDQKAEHPEPSAKPEAEEERRV